MHIKFRLHRVPRKSVSQPVIWASSSKHALALGEKLHSAFEEKKNESEYLVGKCAAYFVP